MGFDGRYGGERSREDEEIESLAAFHGIDADEAIDILAEARRESALDDYRRSPREWFRMVLARRRIESEVVPGKRTGVEAALYGRRRVPADLAPGRRMRTDAEARRRDEYRDWQARAASRRLDERVAQRMGRAFGHDFREVVVRADSPEARGSVRAVVRGEEIHFREGAYQPGTAEGDWLIAHELAHVVQQRGGGGERVGSRRAIEREADAAATLAVRGMAAPVGLRAPVAAYAFDEGEEHGGGDVEAGAETATETETETETETATETATATETETVTETETETAAEVEAVTETAADADGADIDPAAELAAASAPEAADDADGDVPSAGGGPAARPVKAPPSVAGAPPEAGVQQLKGVRPDKLGPALGQVHAAAGGAADQARAKAAASPPKATSAGPAPKAPAKPVAAPVVAAVAAPKEPDDRPVKAEVPGGKEAKQAQEIEAKEEQKTAGQVIDSVGRALASWFGSFLGGRAGEGEGGAMSDAETEQLAGSLDRTATSGAEIATDPGPAPELEMRGEAQGAADRDRAALVARATQLEDQGRADAAVPMGEDAIEATVPTEELTARAIDGAAPDVPLPTVAGMASSEEVGIIAQEQGGADIDAALTKASADMAIERGKHAQEDARARADAERQMTDLKAQADADQAAAKSAARAEVDRARGEWKGEIDKKGADARRQADKKVAEGMAEVEAEQTRANDEARRHVEDARDKAEAEKRKGEKEAADAKAKGRQTSSGFGGWLARKARSLVNRVKKAVTDAIDAAKKAVKAVIDAAKKLAMAAIELARKAITAAIQAIGKALLAITDVLLAAFPELKARFQKVIRGAVDRAVKAVDRIADGLKKAVQKALDVLQSTIDKALDVLEKGLHAIVDAATAVVQAVIEAAEAVAAALGPWLRLIKHVATGPGAWLGKLGAAVVDGIKNHLWGAFKAAVVEWFKSKVMELLGVGGLLLSVLLEGGITTDDIVQMALDALIVAIPVALVAILVEKLVAMIVPAAGALMAVIEGLQAAWGTVSRIIAAFTAFMAFLQAVQGGAAGPLFATALASAAIVLLDFVSSWLLKKLAGPAKKVGARLKGMGAKIRAKRKRTGGKGRPKAHAKPSRTKDGDGHGDARAGKPTSTREDAGAEPAQDKRNAKKEKEEAFAQKEARLHAAVEDVKKISGGGSGLAVIYKARLWNIKRKHKLTRLRATKRPGKAHIYDLEAAINPQAKFETVAIKDAASDLRAAIQSAFVAQFSGRDVDVTAIKRLVETLFEQHLGAKNHYQLVWRDFDDKHVVLIRNSRALKPSDLIPVGAAVYLDEYDPGRIDPRGGPHPVFRNRRTGDDYVDDSIPQKVQRFIVRNVTPEDIEFMDAKREKAGLYPKEDDEYRKKFPTQKGDRPVEEPIGHVVGGTISPYISFTKQMDGDITNSHGQTFANARLKAKGRARVKVDLSFVAPKNIFDLTTRVGQDRWKFSNPSEDAGGVQQALRDVVRTSEVLVRGKIPKKAIVGEF